MGRVSLMLSRWLGAALLVLAFSALGLASGCGASITTSTSTLVRAATTSVASTTTTASGAIDLLSTFQAKDPFIPRVVSTTTSATTTTTRGTTVSTVAPTSTTRPGTTSSTSYPTQTTAGAHYLKLLSVNMVNGVAVCTFEVDGIVYQDKRVGDIVSTSWGEIKVLTISTQQQKVTFLHGSETRTLAVGQRFVK